MEFFGTVLLFVGIVVAFVGGVFFLIVAFKESVLWGLACLFVPLVSLFFLFIHWPKAKNSFFVQLIGAALIFLGAWMGENIPIGPSDTPV